MVLMYSHQSSYGPSQLRHSVSPLQFCGPGTYGARVVVVGDVVVVAKVVVGAGVTVDDVWCLAATARAAPAKMRVRSRRMMGSGGGLASGIGTFLTAMITLLVRHVMGSREVSVLYTLRSIHSSTSARCATSK
jgi:hypothetical protein